MIKATKVLLASDVTANGPWTDVSGYDMWSLMVDQAEEGAVLTVEGRNDEQQPDPDTAGGNLIGGMGSSLSFGSGGFFYPSFALVPCCHWLRVTKTASEAPVLTTATFFGKTSPE